MSIGAMHFDTAIIAASVSPAAPVKENVPSGFDFAAILSAVEAHSGGGSPVDGSVNKTEAFRTSAVSGHLRMTTITFTDGESEHRVEAAGDGTAPMGTPFAVPDHLRPGMVIRALSDLEPEIGWNARPEPRRRGRHPIVGRGPGRMRTVDPLGLPAMPSAKPGISDADATGRLIDMMI